jgi:hypothetical protein
MPAITALADKNRELHLFLKKSLLRYAISKWRRSIGF